MTFTTRFAPSPTGPLHLGHAFSALTAFDLAATQGGLFHLRIDDLDQSRARPHWETQIKDDLSWLGLTWPEPCRRESDCQAEYDAALDALWQMGVLYPCSCSRRDISDALSAPQGPALTFGPDGPVYPGTCRQSLLRSQRWRDGTWSRPRDVHLRLNMAAAIDVLTQTEAGVPSSQTQDSFATVFQETGEKSAQIRTSAQHYLSQIGDVVVARKNMGAAYHLAVVVDDAAQDVTDVVRGADLFEATRIHCLLQTLLGLPQPVYHHHRLICDAAGKRLAKRDDARAIATYRDEGKIPQDIRGMVGLLDR